MTTTIEIFNIIVTGTPIGFTVDDNLKPVPYKVTIELNKYNYCIYISFDIDAIPVRILIGETKELIFAKNICKYYIKSILRGKLYNCFFSNGVINDECIQKYKPKIHIPPSIIRPIII